MINYKIHNHETTQPSEEGEIMFLAADPTPRSHSPRKQKCDDLTPLTWQHTHICSSPVTLSEILKAKKFQRHFILLYPPPVHP